MHDILHSLDRKRLPYSTACSRTSKTFGPFPSLILRFSTLQPSGTINIPGYISEPLRIQIYVKLRTYEELKSLIQRADITFLTLCSGHGSTYRILLIYEGQWPPRDINTMTIRWRKWHFCSIARYFCLTEMVISQFYFCSFGWTLLLHTSVHTAQELEVAMSHSRAVIHT